MVRSTLLRLAALVLLSNVSLDAKEYQWVNSGLGDGSSFSDPGNWYDLSPDADPHNPSGPPGVGDIADLGSSANVSVGSVNIDKLLGSGTSTLTIGGLVNANFVNTSLTLKGGGKLIANNVPTAPVVAGGNLEIASFTGRGLAASNSGTIDITGNLIAPANDTVNIFATDNSVITVSGDALDITGGVESGSRLTVIGLFANLTTTKPTLSVAGAGSSLDLEGDVLIKDGSLDAGNGGGIFVTGFLSLEGRIQDGQILTGNSHWNGNGTTIFIGDRLLVSPGDGAYNLEIGAKAHASVDGDVRMGLIATSKASLSVSEADTQLLINGDVEVGVEGDATLTIQDAAKASLVAGLLSPKTLRVGILPTSDSLVEVKGEGSQLILSSYSVNLANDPGSKASVSVNHGSFQMTGGDELIIGDGGNGSLTLRNGANMGYINVNGTTTIGAKASGNGLFTAGDAGTGASFQGGVIVGAVGTGSIDVFGGAIVTSRSLVIGTHATMNVNDNGQWETATTTAVGGLLDNVAGTGQLTVQSGGTLRSSQDLFVSNRGVVTVLGTGKIAVGQGTFGPSGSVRVELGSLTGSGRIKAPTLVGALGIVRPGNDTGPGTLTVEGDYTHDGGGTLDVQIAGTGANTDLLKVIGNANVAGGKLKVSLAGGFNPPAGQKFKILSATHVTGQFAEVEGADVDYETDGITVTPFVINSTLTVTVDPLNPNRGGKVSTGFEGASSRTVGFTYKMAATPAKGFVFAGWTGDVESTNPNLTFVMEENMVIHANFVPDPFSSSVFGSYVGLAENTGATGPSAGALKLTLGKAGSFTAKFSLSGKTYNFKGSFTGLGQFTREIKVGGKTLTVDLEVALNGADTVTGTISVDGQTYEVGTDRGIFSKKNPTPLAGAYTMRLPPEPGNANAPGGHGWATLVVAPAGGVKVVGRLPDASKIICAAVLAKDGEFALFAPLYRSKGLIAGALTFAPLPRSAGGSDVTGSLEWSKPEEPKNKVFPEAFTATIEPFASFYVLPGRDERVLPSLTANGAAEIRFRGGDLATQLQKLILISTKNVVTYTNPTSPKDKLKLRFTTKTGAFTGTFIHPKTGKPRAFTGVVLQKESGGAGHFLDTADTGEVKIVPQ